MMLKNPQKKSCLYNQHLKLNAFVRTYPCSLKQTNMTKHEKFCTSYEEELYDLHPGMRLIRLETWWSRSSEDPWEKNLRECKSSISNPWSPQIRSCSDGQHLRLNIIAKKRVHHSLKQTSCTSTSTGRKDCSSCKTHGYDLHPGVRLMGLERWWSRSTHWILLQSANDLGFCNGGFFPSSTWEKKLEEGKITLHCKTLNHTIHFIDWILLQSLNDLGSATEDSFPSSDWETELEGKKNLHCKTLNHLQANLYTILFTDWILLQSANELGFCKWRIFSFFQKEKKSSIAKP
jgi:hypothetical protein